jgi:hypothetical protein
VSLLQEAKKISDRFTWKGVIEALDIAGPLTLSYETLLHLGLMPAPSGMVDPPPGHPAWKVAEDVVRSILGEPGAEIGSGWRVASRTDHTIRFER